MILQAELSSFKRRPSVATARADDVRQEIYDLFEVADQNDSGSIDLKELSTICNKKLQMRLTDPIHDVETIFALVDKQNTGTIAMVDFMDLVEPIVQDYEKRGLHMECKEIVREAFSAVIQHAKDERTIVNRAFLWAHEQMNLNGMGLGKYFWGHSWRFRMYDDFYDHATEIDGGRIPPALRLKNLKRKLEGMVGGTEQWLQQKCQVDEKVRHEVFDEQGVIEYCRRWLLRIRQLEADEQAEELEKSTSSDASSLANSLASTVSAERNRRRSLARDVGRTLSSASTVDGDVDEGHLDPSLSLADTFKGSLAASQGMQHTI